VVGLNLLQNCLISVLKIGEKVYAMWLLIKTRTILIEWALVEAFLFQQMEDAYASENCLKRWDHGKKDA
jgi:hypothetical protein